MILVRLKAHNIEIDSKMLGQNLHHSDNGSCMVTKGIYYAFLRNLTTIHFCSGNPLR